MGVPFLVPLTGLEPVRYHYRGILSYYYQKDFFGKYRKKTENKNFAYLAYFLKYVLNSEQNDSKLRIFEFEKICLKKAQIAPILKQFGGN